MSGEKHFNYGKPAFNKGRTWMHNHISAKMVKISETTEYVSMGWVKGRLKPQ